MNGLTAVSTLAGIIENGSDDGVDYLAHAGFDNALEDLINTILNPSTAMGLGITPLVFETGTPDNTRLKEINPNYSTSIPATPVRLDSKLKDVSAANPRDYILEIGTIEGKSNPADWAVQVWELSASQFPSGFTSVDELNFNDTFNFLDDRPVATGFVGAQLDSAKLDVVEIIANKILDALFAKSDDSFKPNEFLLPKNTPTVYVSQAFSGNLWYGTNFFFTAGPGGKSQSNVLASDDPDSQWGFALAGNIMIAAIDIVSVAVDLKDFVKKKTLAGFRSKYRKISMPPSTPVSPSSSASTKTARRPAPAIWPWPGNSICSIRPRFWASLRTPSYAAATSRLQANGSEIIPWP